MASPLLTNDGYRVFALDHGGDNCQSDLAQSAAESGQYVDPVLATTGAATVDVVGHSLRGMCPRLVFLDGAMKADALIAVCATNHGTTSCGMSGLLHSVPEGTTTEHQLFGPTYSQDLTDSAFLTKLNARGETVPGRRCAVIGTKYDDVAIPDQSALLRGHSVTIVLRQDLCPLHHMGHLVASYDFIALHLVLNGLDSPQRHRPDLPPGVTHDGG